MTPPPRIPQPVERILDTLKQAGFEAFIVGGSVRDMLLGKSPKDWDIATKATPETIQKLFPQSVYENSFGTVGVKTESDDQTVKLVQVTTFRTDAEYLDHRHPKTVSFASSIDEDLSRRDFTINAIALDPLDKDKGGVGNLKDPHNGQQDLQQKTIRTVGNPDQRFSEDALRLIRAIRFAATLDFCIEEHTFQSLQKNTHLLSKVARERVGSELLLMFENNNTTRAIELMRKTGILQQVLPEVASGIGVTQNKHHIYDVYNHNLLSLKWADEHRYPIAVKIAALLHDIAKPQTKKGEGPDSTFYGHDIVGGKMAINISKRFNWNKELGQQVALLIRNHMFYYNIGEVTERSVRRLVARVGAENMDDLVKLRICDRMGSGVPKPEPYRLRHFQFLVEKVQKDPLSVALLKINGNDIIKRLGITPGPRVGYILAVLFEQVLDDPTANNKQHLTQQAEKLNQLSDDQLILLREKAKQKEQDVNDREIGKIKHKYYL